MSVMTVSAITPWSQHKAPNMNSHIAAYLHDQKFDLMFCKIDDTVNL